MGGLGSGYFRAKKRTVDRCLVLDVNVLARQGRAGQLNWRDQRTGERLLAMRYRADGRRVMLACVEWSEAIGLTTTRLVSGGLRWWFECPRCGRRMGRLYVPPGERVFACRLCHNLTYLASQRTPRPQAKSGYVWGNVCRVLKAPVENSGPAIYGQARPGHRHST